MIGSNILQKHANSLMEAIWDSDSDADRFEQSKNAKLRKAMVKAIKDCVPQPHIQRIVDLAKQGWKGVDFEHSTTLSTSVNKGTITRYLR